MLTTPYMHKLLEPPECEQKLIFPPPLDVGARPRTSSRFCERRVPKQESGAKAETGDDHGREDHPRGSKDEGLVKRYFSCTFRQSALVR